MMMMVLMAYGVMIDGRWSAEIRKNKGVEIPPARKS